MYSMNSQVRFILEIHQKNTTPNSTQHHLIISFMMPLILSKLKKIWMRKVLIMGHKMNNLRKLLIIFVLKSRIFTMGIVQRIKSFRFTQEKNKKQLLDWLQRKMEYPQFNYQLKIIIKKQFQESIIKFLMSRKLNQL